MTILAGKNDFDIISDAIRAISRRVSELESADAAIFEIKITTGDPTPRGNFHFVINTFDNNVKVYADGGFRTIASGW
jgi:hypothetical protein